jgi:GNAT superfamily N-acetyltransferase
VIVQETGKNMAEIRECREEDFEQILPLLQQLWPAKTLNHDHLRVVYERGRRSDLQHYICAVESGRIAGFCSLTLKNNLWQEGYLAHVDELIVNHADRGRGIGSQLLEAIIAYAVERSCMRVELDTAFHRTEAHAFYERQGFENRAYLFSKLLN